MRSEWLRRYGRLTPYHPGKWRIISRLAPRDEDVRRVAVAQGLELEVDLRGPLGEGLYYLGEYERWDVRQVRKLIQPGWTVLDAGANVGYYTVLLSRWVGPSGLVYAFEPAGNTFAMLMRNLARNHAGNVQAHQMALSERSGEAFLAGESLDDLHLDFHGSGGGEKVQQTTLDAFAEQHGLQRLDFIKVDIEGSEIPFLRGARETLKRFRPAMLIEMNPDTLRAFGAGAADLAGLLREMSYKLLRVHRLWRGLTPLRELPTSLHINVFALPESLG